MELVLTRIAKRKTYTIGHLYIAKEPVGNNPGLGQPLTKGLQRSGARSCRFRDNVFGFRKYTKRLKRTKIRIGVFYQMMSCYYLEAS